MLPFLQSPLFLIPALTGLIFASAGLFMLKFPPKKINGLYGYRTPSSMKSQERWDFAQKYAAMDMSKLGALLALSSSIGIVFTPEGENGTFIGLAMVLITAVLLIVRVERAIKKVFGKEE